MIEATRRGFLIGMLAAAAAPVIVRAHNIMPIKVPPIARAAAISQAVTPEGAVTYVIRGRDVYGALREERMTITDLGVPRWSQGSYATATLFVVGQDGNERRVGGGVFGGSLDGTGRVPVIGGEVMALYPDTSRLLSKIDHMHPHSGLRTQAGYYENGMFAAPPPRSRLV